jgi:hypothetical protein
LGKADFEKWVAARSDAVTDLETAYPNWNEAFIFDACHIRPWEAVFFWRAQASHSFQLPLIDSTIYRASRVH